MGDEKSPLHDQIERAVEVGDAKETQSLLLKDEHVEWVRKQAFKDVRELVKSETGWPAWRILVHTQALVGRLERQLRVAEADRNSLRRRIAELEVRYGALKQSATAYVGVWREDAGPYSAGSLATHKGALWHAWKATMERPGTGSDWQMMTKTHGKDER